MTENCKFENITSLPEKEALDILGFKLVHIGVNCESKEDAQKSAMLVSGLFGYEFKPGNKSTFAGKDFEFMHIPYYGKNGHIAIATSSPDAAREFLASKGIEFIEETAAYDENGKLKVIYLKEEICGFAIHLVQKK